MGIILPALVSVFVIMAIGFFVLTAMPMAIGLEGNLINFDFHDEDKIEPNNSPNEMCVGNCISIL